MIESILEAASEKNVFFFGGATDNSNFGRVANKKNGCRYSGPQTCYLLTPADRPTRLTAELARAKNCRRRRRRLGWRLHRLIFHFASSSCS